MSKLREVSIVVAGGALGGLVSVLDSWADPVSYPLTLAKVALLLVIPAVKGSAAAGIGIYLLTTFDSSQVVRGFFFALTCGLAFPSILSNGTSYAQKVTSQVATTTIADSAQKLKNAKEPSDIQAASIEIIQATPRVEAAQAGIADAAVQQAVSQLGKAADPTNSEKTVDAIAQIGTAAANQKLPAATTQAVTELKSLSTDTRLSEQTKVRASVALEKLEKTGLAIK